MSTYVLNIQKACKAAGFDPGPLDGELGQKTFDAVLAALATLPIPRPKPTRHQCAAAAGALASAMKRDDVTPEAMAMLFRDYNAMCVPLEVMLEKKENSK